MSNIYRKTLKGIDEMAFKTTGLPMRLMSYLLAVDGESSADQLAARNQQLPSMAEVLQGLAGQGFLEVAGTAANVVNISQMRVGNGTNSFYADGQQPQAPQQQQPPSFQPQQQPQQQPQYQPQQPQQYQQPMQQPAGFAAAPANYFPELDIYKTNMTRDISVLLGADAPAVIQKIQACKTRDDLFSAMMGIKKIITIYTDRAAAEKFATRYNGLSN